MKAMAELAEVEFAFLGERDRERSWAGFLETCLGTVERAVRRAAIDAEEARDVLAEVLTRIRADWPVLLERYAAGKREVGAAFRPWLAVVARRLAIDVLRSWHGRPTPPRSVQRMPPVRQRLFQLLYRERRRLEEAYDVLVAEGAFAGGYAELAAEVRLLEDELPPEARAAAATPRRPARARGGDAEADGRSEPAASAGERPAELAARRGAHAGLARILAELGRDERLLLRAYYLEGATAADAARLTGAASARAVYERAQKLLGRLREALGRHGLGPEDLTLLTDFDWTAALAAEDDA
jgi:RNA polymerase sigma factor (sigma-70 family)